MPLAPDLGLNLQTLSFSDHQEHFLSATAEPGETVAELFARAASVLERSRGRILSLEVFGAGDCEAALREAFGEPEWPVTRVETTSPAGLQVWAIGGLAVEVIRDEGRVVGTTWSDRHALSCRLGDLRPADVSAERPVQARQAFEAMERVLREQGMSFANVARTWLYFDRILEWYGPFNRARDEFFRSRGLFDGLVPASTGMGGSNPFGAAMVTGVLAALPLGDGLRFHGVPSPLQCPALEYGSSFSRALEVETPDARRLYVSGTASIGAGGLSIEHVGDVDAQLERTVEVITAILESRGASWSDATRAIGYFKHLADLAAWERNRERLGLPELPILLVQNEICFEELLFELEVDTILV